MLIAIAPQMYREAVVHTIRSRRPDVEVETCPPEDLDRRLALLEPDFLLCHDTAPEARERVRPGRDPLQRQPGRNHLREDQATRIADISLERLLTFLDLIAILE